MTPTIRRLRDARGTILGITRGTTAAHIARAALEATALQTRDVVDAMESDTGLELPVLRVDGGGTANRLLMQFQSDILGTPIERCSVPETTALGAAYLAGLSVGLWEDLDEIAGLWDADLTFRPEMEPERSDRLYGEWKRAVERAKGWATGSESPV